MLHKNKRSSSRPRRQKNNNAGKALSAPPPRLTVAVTRVPGCGPEPSRGLPSGCRGGSGTAPVPPAPAGWVEQSCSPSIRRGHLHPHRSGHRRATGGRAVPVPSSPQLQTDGLASKLASNFAVDHKSVTRPDLHLE